MILKPEETKQKLEEMETKPEEVRKALIKVSDDINQKRKAELIRLFSQSTEWTDYIREQRKLGEQRSKSKVWRKVASIPLEVDRFFTKIYGKDYYKDKDFFRKIAPEWRVFD